MSTKQKHPGGRPSKYGDHILPKINEYMAPFYEDETLTSPPTIEGLALFLNLTPQTLHNWLNDNDKPEFFEALGQLKAKQKEMLFHHGLMGHYNPTIAKLILSANHGVSETTKNDHTSSDGSFAPSRIELVPLKGKDDG